MSPRIHSTGAAKLKGKLRLERAAANEAVRQMEFAYIKNRFDVLTDVRQQFYTVLAAQRRVEALNGLLKVSQESQRAAEGRVKAGEGPSSWADWSLSTRIVLYSTHAFVCSTE